MAVEGSETVQWQPGQAVEWKYTTSKGWGYTWWIPATVVRVTRCRVVIDADLEAGGTRRINVTAARLRNRQAASKPAVV